MEVGDAKARLPAERALSRSRPHQAAAPHDTLPLRTTATADTLAIMGVPFEALLPYAIMTGVRLPPQLAALGRSNGVLQFFAFSAVSVGKLKEMQNGGKRTRRGIDAWDRVCHGN